MIFYIIVNSDDPACRVGKYFNSKVRELISSTYIVIFNLNHVYEKHLYLLGSKSFLVSYLNMLKSSIREYNHICLWIYLSWLKMWGVAFSICKNKFNYPYITKNRKKIYNVIREGLDI